MRRSRRAATAGRLVLSGLLASAIWLASDQTARTEQVPGSAPTVAEAPPRAPFSANAIWRWVPNRDAIQAACGRESLLGLQPDQPGDAGCILAVMRDGGASAEARQFFELTRTFLAGFNELGPVDLGWASSPWVNMDRPEFVFLNGLPSAIPIGQATNARPEDWKNLPGYPELLGQYPQAFPWIEYAHLVDNQNLPDGSQRIVIAFTMQECRACPIVAEMPVAFSFDARLVLVGREILPPNPHRAAQRTATGIGTFTAEFWPVLSAHSATSRAVANQTPGF